ncbi:MAG: GNAT family N-acetyltransferase [Clostridia bacterium]|nr:GNAT family N-acetyltransferase [Clostridia bacterium]
MNKHFIYNIFSRIPILETERLTLRRMRPDDAADMFEYARRADVTEYLTWNPHPDEARTREYLKMVQKQYEDGEFYDWAVVHRATGKMIGTCGFTSFDDDNNAAEIGYVLNPAFHGQGLAAEAAWEVLNFGFLRLNLHRITARYMEGNAPSRRVMEKVGMSFEGTFRSAVYIKGAYRTVSACAILREEFLARKEQMNLEKRQPFL